jgi:hypothetical protein
MVPRFFKRCGLGPQFGKLWRDRPVIGPLKTGPELGGALAIVPASCALRCRPRRMALGSGIVPLPLFLAHRRQALRLRFPIALDPLQLRL